MQVLKKQWSNLAAFFAVLAMVTFMVTACSNSNKYDGVLLNQEGSPTPNELASSTQAGGHGMVVFGKDAIYMYHLPMWHGLHAWQIILEVTLDSPSLALYKNDRNAGSTLNTLSPKAFALANLAPGFVFKGDLFHGHFEQGGSKLGRTEAAVTVKRIVMITPLGTGASAFAAPTYRLFGHGSEWYAAHVVSVRPNFDQILQLSPVPNTVTEAQLNAGIKLTTPGRSDLVGKRLTTGQTAKGQLESGKALAVSVVGESYFSTVDLGQ